MEDHNCSGCAAAVAVFVALILGFIAGVKISSNAFDIRWQKDAIKRGYAEFNSKTGAWQWKEPVKAESEAQNADHR